MSLIAVLLWSANLTARAQQPPAPPIAEPELNSKLDGTTIALSAGGQLATGNSRLLATTADTAFETRWVGNVIALSLQGNYGRSAPPGEDMQVTTENLQGRARYDRYLVDRAAVFVINTGRHDRFQGIAFRYNLDPGFKYLWLKAAETSAWAEAGYDFQYDVRLDAARSVMNPDGTTSRLERTSTDHSLRAFVGFKHAFNPEVNLASGVEYLQSFIESRQFRINFDVLFAAQLGVGLAIGFGFSGRYDHHPLPDKKDLDIATTLSLIYAFSDVEKPAPPPPPPCNCPPAPPCTCPPSNCPPPPPA